MRRSRMSRPTFLASSTTSIMVGDCIQHSAISALCSSRTNTPSRGSKRQLDVEHPQGRTPIEGQSSTPIDKYARTRAFEGQARRRLQAEIDRPITESIASQTERERPLFAQLRRLSDVPNRRSAAIANGALGVTVLGKAVTGVLSSIGDHA